MTEFAAQNTPVKVLQSMSILSTIQQTLLTSAAEDADRLPNWPEISWQVLQESGMLGWSVPNEFGGLGKGTVDFLVSLEEIATCCLTTTFILSQRESAVRRLLKGPEHLKSRYLPRLATGEIFLTVGLSQLTTSRQHLGPALRATRLMSGGFRLEGEIPWVTGAMQADAIVVGATLDDAGQLLIVIPADLIRGMIEPSLPLAALVGSQTSLIRCRGVEIPPDCILAGPAESVLGQVGGGGLETSCLAIGLASSAIRFMRHEAVARPFLAEGAEHLEQELLQVRARLHELAVTSPDPERTLELRTDCTKLALRATQAGLVIAKGNGFISPHPTQRWARQALFFLVWSCPRSVSEGVLAGLIDGN